MTSLPITPPTARAGTATKSAAPPPGGASGDFAALLTQTTARTAHAEGPKTRPQEPRHDTAASQDDAASRSDPADRGQTPICSDGANRGQTPSSEVNIAAVVDGQAQVPVPTDQAVQPALVVPSVPSADPAAVAVAAQVVAQAALTQQTPPAVAVGVPAGAPGTAVAGQPGAPADPQALAVLAADAQPVDPNAAAAPVADGTTPGKLEIPAELIDAKTGAHPGGEGKNFNKDGTPQRDLPPAPTLAPADGATTSTPTPTSAPSPTAAAAVPPAEAAPVAQTLVPTIAQAQPTATAQTIVPTAAVAPQLTRGSVVQTAERVEELVRIATTRSGNARATLQLKPEALGQVDVHLRTSREGLVATIAAHDQAGLDALQQAGGELRRLLEDRGVQLHSLDLQLSADSEGFTHQRDARQAESGRGGAAVSYGLADDEDVVAEDELILTTAPSTSSSSLVDVTA